MPTGRLALPVFSDGSFYAAVMNLNNRGHITGFIKEMILEYKAVHASMAIGAPRFFYEWDKVL